MRCRSCSVEIPSSARFCPGCGKAAPAAVQGPKDTSITAEGVRPGVWRWALLLLLLAERLVAWKAFPLAESASWERVFFWAWSPGLLILAAPLLAFRRRAGGWLAFLSGMALIGRSCVPLVGEDPAAWAVVTLMVASATLTFAFLFEQSFWPHLPSPIQENQAEGRPGEDR